MDRVLIRVPDPDGILDGYGAGAILHPQRSFDPADFSAADDLADIPVVAGDYLYPVWDTSTTAAWYRWRAESASGSQLGQWSDAFGGTDPAVSAYDEAAYATLDDLFLALPGEPPPDASGRKRARMLQALAQARVRLDREMGVSFFREPASGTTTRILDGPGGDRLHLHDGIVSLTTVEVRYSITSDWEEVSTDDWAFEETPVGGEPYFHVVLLGAVQYVVWPRGRQLIRLTGAFNWSRPPSDAIAANVALARQSLAADPSFVGGIVGPPQFGQPVGPNRTPEEVYRLKRWHVERFMGCRV